MPIYDWCLFRIACVSSKFNSKIFSNSAVRCAHCDHEFNSICICSMHHAVISFEPSVHFFSTFSSHPLHRTIKNSFHIFLGMQTLFDECIYVRIYFYSDSTLIHCCFLMEGRCYAFFVMTCMSILSIHSLVVHWFDVSSLMANRFDRSLPIVWWSLDACSLMESNLIQNMT